MLEAISKLKKLLEQYDRVILLAEPELFLEIKATDWSDKKVLFLSTGTIEFTGNVESLQVSMKEIEEFMDIYYTYEFSDRFKVVMNSVHSFAGVLNLYRNGNLNDDELFGIIID